MKKVENSKVKSKFKFGNQILTWSTSHRGNDKWVNGDIMPPKLGLGPLPSYLEFDACYSRFMAQGLIVLNLDRSGNPNLGLRTMVKT